jgi:SOS-response transcriptional repressor LexA
MNTRINDIILENVKKLLRRRGITQKRLSEMIDVQPQNLNAYMTGKREFGKSYISRISEAFGVTAETLYIGTGAGSTKTKRARKVPLISWVKAGLWQEAVDIYGPGYADEWLAYDTGDEHAFALRVEGDSMEPEFKSGDIIVVSPSVDPVSGDFVVAKYGDDVTLKRLKYIMPPLPGHPSTPGPGSHLTPGSSTHLTPGPSLLDQGDSQSAAADDDRFARGVMLKPLNPNYDDMVITGRKLKELRIVGKVVAKYVKY